MIRMNNAQYQSLTPVLLASILLLFAAPLARAQRQPARAGTGDYHRYFPSIQASGSAGPDASTDTRDFQPDRDYISIDAVSWYVNDQGGALADRFASGTVEISNLGGPTYQIALGQYRLGDGAHTAPVFDKTLIETLVYRTGARPSFLVFLRGVQEDTVLGSTLKNLAQSSLGIASGVLQTASTTSVGGQLLAGAGSSLIGGVQDLLKAGKKPLELFDLDNGMDVSTPNAHMRGPVNYVLLHRGSELVEVNLKVKEQSDGSAELLYGDNNPAPLTDGVWILFRIRREAFFSRAKGPRPWEDNNSGEATLARNHLDSLMGGWTEGNPDQALQDALKRSDSSSQKTVADEIIHAESVIGEDQALSYYEQVYEEAKLQALLILARKAVEAKDATKYVTTRNTFLQELRDGNVPSNTDIAWLFTSDATDKITAKTSAGAAVALPPGPLHIQIDPLTISNRVRNTFKNIGLKAGTMSARRGAR